MKYKSEVIPKQLRCESPSSAVGAHLCVYLPCGINQPRLAGNVSTRSVYSVCQQDLHLRVFLRVRISSFTWHRCLGSAVRKLEGISPHHTAGYEGLEREAGRWGSLPASHRVPGPVPSSALCCPVPFSITTRWGVAPSFSGWLEAHKVYFLLAFHVQPLLPIWCPAYSSLTRASPAARWDTVGFPWPCQLCSFHIHLTEGQVTPWEVTCLGTTGKSQSRVSAYIQPESCCLLSITKVFLDFKSILNTSHEGTFSLSSTLCFREWGLKGHRLELTKYLGKGGFQPGWVPGDVAVWKRCWKGSRKTSRKGWLQFAGERREVEGRRG